MAVEVTVQTVEPAPTAVVVAATSFPHSKSAFR
jgi:hypothetical protein